MAADADLPITWQLAIVLRAHWGEPVDDLVRLAEAVSGGPFLGRAQVTRTPSLTYDIASFRGVPRDGQRPGAERRRTAPPFPVGRERRHP
jgi:hypothetical protein